MRPNFAHERQAMVRSQIVTRGVQDPRVLAALTEVPRDQFVADDLRAEAYQDRPLAIGYEQTISQPFTVAFMAARLRLEGWEKVLEVGTGSGYGAAILSRLANEVHTIERIAELAQHASSTLQRLGYHNVHVHIGDGSRGLPACQPFDAICVAAAADEVPAAYFDQLADGGRLVIPVGDSGWRKQMLRYTKRDGELHVEELGEFAFVPLIRD